MGDVVVVVIVVAGVPVDPHRVVAPGEGTVERVEVVVDVVVEVFLALLGDAQAIGEVVSQRPGVVDAEFTGIAGFTVRYPGAQFAAEFGFEFVEIGLLAQVIDVAATARHRTVGHRGRAGDDVGAFVGVEVGRVAHAVCALPVLEHFGTLGAELRGEAGVLAAAASNAGGVFHQVIGAADRVAGQLLGVDLGDGARRVEHLGFDAAVDGCGWPGGQRVIVGLAGGGLDGDGLQLRVGGEGWYRQGRHHRHGQGGAFYGQTKGDRGHGK
ncbi:hypothetical protein D3C84_587250 [compost metagenome]